MRGISLCYTSHLDVAVTEEAGAFRRSIATLPPQAPIGLDREWALAVLGQRTASTRNSAAALRVGIG